MDDFHRIRIQLTQTVQSASLQRKTLKFLICPTMQAIILKIYLKKITTMLSLSLEMSIVNITVKICAYVYHHFMFVVYKTTAASVGWVLCRGAVNQGFEDVGSNAVFGPEKIL